MNLKITLPLEPKTDTMFWEGESRGIYTVRSGFYVHHQLEAETGGEPFTITKQDPIRKHIWALKLPTKVKVFAWRAAKDSLPTREKLMHRRVPVEVHCPFYNYSLEDLHHALFSYPQLSQVWAQHLPGSHPELNRQSVQSLMRTHLQNNSDCLETFITIAWGLWYWMNMKIFEDTNTHPMEAASDALSRCSNFKVLQAVNPSQAARHIRWLPPEKECWKLNVDGAIFLELSMAGVGCVV